MARLGARGETGVEDREVRLGIVGVGGMGQAHVRGLAGVAGARLVAVCDRDGDLAKSVAEPLGAAVYTEGAAMIAEAEIEALYICVPPHSHEDLELLAAERGLHLFVEKPVNLYVPEALRARDAIRRAGVMTQTGYQLRYQPHFQQLRALLAGRKVGAASVCRWGGAPGKDWWRRYDQGGGQLVEMTTHQVDMLRWVMGEVEAVSASYSFERLFEGEYGITVPDSQTALLRFESGASATVNTSCAAGKAGLNTMDFVIRDGKVSVKGETVTVEPEGAIALPPLPGEAMTADEAFVRAVATGDRSLLLSPYEDGLRTAAVTLAANRSAEQGGRLVRIDEVLAG
jgi:predicted dehydrogenase